MFPIGSRSLKSEEKLFGIGLLLVAISSIVNANLKHISDNRKFMIAMALVGLIGVSATIYAAAVQILKGYNSEHKRTSWLKMALIFLGVVYAMSCFAIFPLKYMCLALGGICGDFY
jgi:thiol:disulfide interchange protein